MHTPMHTTAAAYAARIDDASTREELAELYVEIIGYDPTEDDPGITDQEIRATLNDYVAEMAASNR